MKYIVLSLFWVYFCMSTNYAYSKPEEASDIWIFCAYSDSESVDELNKLFQSKYEFDAQAIHVHFSNGEAGYEASRKSDILHAISLINEKLKEHSCLMIFLGHSNRTAKDVHYNIPGPDVTVKEIAEAIQMDGCNGKLGIIWACESGEKALKLLSGENRIVLAAAETEDRDNEPVLNEILLPVLKSDKLDENTDKQVSFAELHALAKKELEKWYQSRGFVQLEKILLDGDGDGTGTFAPADKDKLEAENILITLKKQKKQ